MDRTYGGGILAIISRDKEKISAGGCPVFLVKDLKEQEKLALILARTLDAVVHDLENGILFICRH